MSKEVLWTKLIVETFVSEACLTKLEEMILRTRAAGWSRQKQCAEFNISMSTCDRTIKSLKHKYDSVQKYNPILPPRKPSNVEDELDGIN